MIMKSGSPKFANSSAVGRMNMLVTKCACHATSMMKRSFRREFSFAPQNASTTKSLLLESCLTAKSLTTDQHFASTGLLSFLYSSEVHQTVFSLVASFTKNLSLGERPV